MLDMVSRAYDYAGYRVSHDYQTPSILGCTSAPMHNDNPMQVLSSVVANLAHHVWSRLEHPSQQSERTKIKFGSKYVRISKSIIGQPMVFPWRATRAILTERLSSPTCGLRAPQLWAVRLATDAWNASAPCKRSHILNNPSMSVL